MPHKLGDECELKSSGLTIEVVNNLFDDLNDDE